MYTLDERERLKLKGLITKIGETSLEVQRDTSIDIYQSNYSIFLIPFKSATASSQHLSECYLHR
jgi:hypothetical protein